MLIVYFTLFELLMTNKALPKLTIQSISKSGGRFILQILPPIVVADINCRLKKTSLTRHPT